MKDNVFQGIENVTNEVRNNCILTLIFKAMSPDGESIVTGAGDETLRFWNVFNKTRSTKVPQQLLMLIL